MSRQLICKIQGQDTAFCISKESDVNSYDISFVKNEHVNNLKFCNWDVLVFSKWKLTKLAEWLKDVPSKISEWDNLFDTNENGIFLNCNCHSEWLRVEIIEFDKNDLLNTDVFFTIFTSFKKYKLPKQLTTQFVVKYKDLKEFIKLFEKEV